MTPEEQKKVDEVTRKLLGERTPQQVWADALYKQATKQSFVLRSLGAANAGTPRK